MTFIFALLVSLENFVPFGQIMDLAKDLAWQKVFSGRSTNLKVEKWGIFFFAFSLLSRFILSHSPIISDRMKLKLKILTLNGRSTDKKIINCFSSAIFFTFNF